LCQFPVFLYQVNLPNKAEKKKKENMKETTKNYRIGGHQFLSKDALPFVPRDEVRTIDEPLSNAERFFIEKFLPGLVAFFDANALARIIDYTGNFFLVYLKKVVAEENTAEGEELNSYQVQSVPMPAAEFAIFAQQRAEEQQQLLGIILNKAVSQAKQQIREERDPLGR
jgi:hypothetical protein